MLGLDTILKPSNEEPDADKNEECYAELIQFLEKRLIYYRNISQVMVM